MKNTQEGPNCDVLLERVRLLRYKPGWTFELHEHMPRPTEWLQGGAGTTLSIKAIVPDSGDPESRAVVDHWFAVPPVELEPEEWERWLLHCILEVEKHEAMEFFCVDGVKPYFPSHGGGRSPYVIERKR